MSHSEPTPTESRIGPRRRIVPRGESGQIILMYLFFLLPMTMIVLSVFNVGQIVSEKMLVQNAADNAAYSAAVWEARYMNLTAYTSRAMVANYDTMATILAVWSMIDALDGFLWLAKEVVTFIPYVGPELRQAVDAVHRPVGTLNDQYSSNVVGGNSESNGRFEFVLEKINGLLSLSEVILYVATQFGRPNVIQSIAWSTDKNIQYNTIAEILNALSLDNRVKWDKTDKENGLRLTTERSLNEFSNGGSLRDLLANALPQPLRSLLNFNIDLLFCDIGISVGPKGFNGPPFDHVSGRTTGPEQEEDTVIVQPDKLYQHDFMGITIKVCFSFDIGHHSDDAFNNRGLTPPHIFDYDHINEHANNFSDIGINCSSAGGAVTGAIPEFGKMQSLQTAMQECEQQEANNNDDNPDNNQFPPTAIVDGVPTACSCTTIPCPPNVKDQLEETVDDLEDSTIGGLGGNPCATIYTWATKLEDMKVTTYRGDDAVIDGRRAEGPTVFAYFRKQRTALPLFAGLGLDNKNDLEAYSMAKVYYMQRVGDKDNSPCSKDDRRECNRESAFNPFWSARLERPDLLGGIFLH
jgi:hypothetical protein